MRYARQAPAVLARAGLRSATVRAKRVPLARSTICRATDSDRLCLELPAVSLRIGKDSFLLSKTFRRIRTGGKWNGIVYTVMTEWKNVAYISD